MKNKKILIADDQKNTVKLIKEILESNGYNNIKTTSKIRAFKDLEGFDVVILDIVWPASLRPRGETSDYFGLIGLRYLRTYSPGTKVILMSEHLYDLEYLSQIREADGYFKSKASPSHILQIVAKVISKFNEEIYSLLNILKQTVSDGNPELFRIKEDDYNDLVKLIDRLEKDYKKEGIDKSKWINVLENTKSIASTTKNLVDIISTIKDLF